MVTKIAQLAKVKTTTPDNREYIHYGTILVDGTFLYDGNWQALDNDLYVYHGDPRQARYPKETIPFGFYDID